jgi:hypothetical protein
MDQYDFQMVCRSVGLPTLHRYSLQTYGCTKCQVHHIESEAMFDAHLYWQSKHGLRPSFTYVWLLANEAYNRYTHGRGFQE